MAPRGRPRGVGLTRMHAAIDALKPMGFSTELIRCKVNHLLEVYGGVEGWAFIEEAYYKLLIENILEDQEREKCEPGEPNLVEDQEMVNRELGEPSFKDWQIETRVQGVDTEPSEAGPLFVADKPSCSQHDAALLSPNTVPDLPSLPPQNRNIPTQNSAFSEDFTGFSMQDVQEQIAEVLHACEHSASPGFEQLPRQHGSATSKPKRKPCLGWIGPKVDDEFVLLEPVPVEGQEERHKARGNFKSRWDEKPDGVM